MTRQERIDFARKHLEGDLTPNQRAHWERMLAGAEAKPLDWVPPPESPALKATAARLAKEVMG